MAVNFTPTKAEELLPIPGVALGIAQAGIRKANRRDLLLIRLDEHAAVAGVFTQNRFCAAPVVVCRDHLQGGAIRALVINTGIANAGTGEPGMQAARATCAAAARLLGCAPRQVLPFSTGVIMEPLPAGRIEAGLPACVADLREDNWAVAAEAIMTTDTLPKAVSRKVSLRGTAVTVTGIAKGAGMIRPNMATMLGFVATDAAVAQPLLARLVREAADASFNCITVDGDTSTNDSFMLIASGRAGNAPIADAASDDYAVLKEAVTAVAAELAQAIVRDGEGATKFVTVQVNGGGNAQECLDVAYAVAHSPLIKTALFASDPNWGRILAAVGYAGVPQLDVSLIDVFLGDVCIASQGGRAASYTEEQGAAVMAQAEIGIRIELGRGQFSETIWTTDLSHEYVRINAEYRS